MPLKFQILYEQQAAKKEVYYTSMFRINNTFGSISIMNPELYDRAEEGEGVELKEYIL